jgi:hypothetical protein
VLVKRLRLHDERQQFRQELVRIGGLQHEGGVRTNPLEVCDRDFAQVRPAGPVEHLSDLEAHVKGRSEVPVAYVAPSTKAQVVGIHVLARDISLKA